MEESYIYSVYLHVDREGRKVEYIYFTESVKNKIIKMKGKDRDSNSYSARNWLFCNLGVGSRSFSMGSSQHRD